MSSSFTNDFHHHLPSSSSSDQHRRLSVNNGIHIRQPVSAVTSTSTVVAGQLPFRFPASSSADSPSSLPRAVISSNDTTFSSSLDLDSPMGLPSSQARSSGRHLMYQFPFTAQPTTATTQPPRNQGLSAASEFAAQYINASPLQHMGANTFPFPASSSSSSNNAVSAPNGGNYLLGTPRSAASTSSSSFGTTPSSFTSDSFSAASPTHHSGTDAAADAFPSYSTAAHSLPSTIALQSSSVTSPVAASAMPVSWAGPSSAPPAPPQWENYIAPEEMMIGSPGMAGFYAGMSGLGIDGNVKRHDSMGTISPRDVLMGSATVIDNDDFSNAGSPTVAAIGRDYPAVGGFGGQRSTGGFSSSYPGYSTGAVDYPLDLGFNGVSNSPLMFGGYSNNLYTTNSPQFGTAVPPHQSQSPTMDMVTQFNLELDGEFAKPSLIDANKTPHATAMSFDTSSPTNTIRGPKKPNRPEFGGVIDTALSVKFENENAPWPLSSRPLRKTTKAFDEDAVDEEDEDEDEDDNADDDDYVDESHHHGAGPHRTARRMSSTAVTPNTPTSNPKRRSPPYSRSARPSLTNLRRPSHPASEKDRPSAATLTPKKVKSVKWESTKPKYWIPEGFDPWWDQKSRGRGVATVSTSAPSSFDGVRSDGFVNDGTFVDSSDSWPANYLPEDWRELVRGKGNPARPFVCPAVNCGKTFQRSEHAKRHAWSLHTPDAVKVSCPFEGCDHKSTRGDNLKQHIGSHKRKSGGAAALRRRSEGGANGVRRKVKYEEEGDDDEASQWA